MNEASQAGRDVWIWIGIATVASAAAVMSFDALRRLAERAGVAPQLAWLLPVAIDAAVVVSTRAWLGTRTSARVTSYARRLALVSLGMSVAGNATEHGMTAYTITTPWWVVVAVSAVPPAMLGAIAHLAALAAADRTDTQNQVAQVAAPAATATPDQAEPAPPATGATATRAALPAGGKAALMRATFERYRDEGRLDELTGAELARSANAADSLGRRYLNQWRAEFDDTATADEQAA